MSTPETKIVTLPAHLFDLWAEKLMEVSEFIEKSPDGTSQLRALGATHEVIGGLRSAAASGVGR